MACMLENKMQFMSISVLTSTQIPPPSFKLLDHNGYSRLLLLEDGLDFRQLRLKFGILGRLNNQGRVSNDRP